MEESRIQRNITREILRELMPKKFIPNEDFVAFYIKLLLLDSDWGVTDDYSISRTNIQKFVKYVVGSLMSESLELSTIRTQFSYKCHIKSFQQQIERYRKNLLKRLQPLKLNIVKTLEPKNMDDWYNLRKKIVYFVTLLYGLGNPNNEQVFQETLRALESVMSDVELKEFVNWPKSTKETNLLHLSKIITGIRLFNKDCGKGGAGIPKLPTLVDSAISSLKCELQNALLCTISNVNVLTTFIEDSYDLIEHESGYKLISNERLPEFWETKVIDMLIFFRQMELSIRKVIREMELIEQSAHEVYEQFRSLLMEIHQKVEFRIAVAVNVVFPLFENLAGQWNQLQNKVYSLEIFERLLKSFGAVADDVDFQLMWNSIDYLQTGFKALSDAERMEHTAKFTLSSERETLFVVKPEMLQNMDNIGLQYLGFCPWKIVQTKGGLIPGNPSMGLIQYKKQFFVFSCPEAFQEFSKRPEWYINEIMNIVKKKPQLVDFFDMQEQLLNFSDASQKVQDKTLEKKTKEKGIQTCDNYADIVPPNKDTSYKWNIWDMKKEALELAKAQKCKTRESQTNKTYLRETVVTQTNEYTTKSTQTMKDEYTNMSKPGRIIFGLRGRKGNQHCLVDIGRPSF